MSVHSHLCDPSNLGKNRLLRSYMIGAEHFTAFWLIQQHSKYLTLRHPTFMVHFRLGCMQLPFHKGCMSSPNTEVTCNPLPYRSECNHHVGLFSEVFAVWEGFHATPIEPLTQWLYTTCFHSGMHASPLPQEVASNPMQALYHKGYVCNPYTSPFFRGICV